MMHTTAVKKKKAWEKNIDDMLVQEYQGYANFVIGRVRKLGREFILKQAHTSPFEVSEFYWLKKEYTKIIDHAHELRMKQIPTKLAGTGLNGEILINVQEGNPETNGVHLQAPRFSVSSLQ